MSDDTSESDNTPDQVQYSGTVYDFTDDCATTFFILADGAVYGMSNEQYRKNRYYYVVEAEVSSNEDYLTHIKLAILWKIENHQGPKSAKLLRSAHDWAGYARKSGGGWAKMSGRTWKTHKGACVAFWPTRQYDTWNEVLSQDDLRNFLDFMQVSEIDAAIGDDWTSITADSKPPEATSTPSIQIQKFKNLVMAKQLALHYSSGTKRARIKAELQELKTKLAALTGSKMSDEAKYSKPAEVNYGGFQNAAEYSHAKTVGESLTFEEWFHRND